MDGLLLTGIRDDLVIPVAFDWPSPDRILEAIGDSAAKRAQKANRAGQQVISDRFKLERATQEKIAKQLATLKDALMRRLLTGDGSVTDFRRFTLTQLTADVDRLITDTTSGLTTAADTDYKAADTLGIQAAQEPMAAADLHVTKALPGLDTNLVQAAFGNTVDLLTPPMQKYATNVKVALRGVALAGDNKFAAIAKLRDQIGGPNLQQAQFQAERIIRTELGRVFNQATYARLVSLSKDFPFLRKGWRATADSRTRAGHREAGQTYARGQGIKVDEPFRVNVYDERGGKNLKLIGVATLQFPVDPNAKPEGRVAAGATIMCRCNSFVDMNQADFAAYTRAKVSIALGNVQRPAPEPAPKPVPLPKPNTPAMAKPKVKTPKVKVPKPADVRPSTQALGPAGPKVSDAVNLDPPTPQRFLRKSQQPLSQADKARVRRALQLIDSVHGDGNLPTIPVYKVDRRRAAKGVLAYYARTMNDVPLNFGYGPRALGSHPNMATAHETGHFIDHAGITQGKEFATESAAVMDAWAKATKNSKAIQSMDAWRRGDGAPQGVNQRILDYMLSSKETWARSYAQYIAVTSGDPAMLRELRNMQGAAAIGKVDPKTEYNAGLPGKPARPGTWDYPWAWSDEDFAPIKAAIDDLFKGLGWRVHK